VTTTKTNSVTSRIWLCGWYYNHIWRLRTCRRWLFIIIT